MRYSAAKPFLLNPLRSALLGVAVLFAAAWLVGRITTLPSERRSGEQALSFNRHVASFDGTRIAVTVWLPGNRGTGRVPVVLRATRYVRAYEVSVWGRLLWRVGLLTDADVGLSDDIKVFNSRGFAVVIVDERGSGASFGNRRAEAAPEEIRDFESVLDWSVSQPWCDGRAVAWGISQDGLYAELLAARGNPALRAIAPIYAPFDSQFESVGFFGLYNRENVRRWARLTSTLDSNGPKCLGNERGCRLKSWIAYNGIMPVDGAEGRMLLKRALAERSNYDVDDGWHSILYRDDPIGTSGLSMKDIMPFGVSQELGSASLPTLTINGWLDAGLPMGALERFVNVNSPQQVILGPFSHGGRYNGDPFASPEEPSPLPEGHQLQLVADFFERALEQPERSANRAIIYYLLGSHDQWRTTEQWPPTDSAQVTLYFAAGYRLAADTSLEGSGSDQFDVDFSAGTGRYSRFSSIVGGTPIVYADRARQTAALLHYDSSPMTRDMELVGSPVAEVRFTSTRMDGALYVYLDDVSPQGKVTYLSEGELRLLFNKAPTADRGYQTLGVARGFSRLEAGPLVPNQTYAVAVELFPVAALIRTGHHLRVSLAGADADAMPRIPASGPAPRIDVLRDPVDGSRIVLRLKPYTRQQPSNKLFEWQK